MPAGAGTGTAQADEKVQLDCSGFREQVLQELHITGRCGYGGEAVGLNRGTPSPKTYVRPLR